jgi:hypothetical protein
MPPGKPANLLKLVQVSGTRPKVRRMVGSPKLPSLELPVRLKASAPTFPSLRDIASALRSAVPSFGHSIGFFFAIVGVGEGHARR